MAIDPEIQKAIDSAVADVEAFSTKKVGDTPTDAVQLVNKKYADTKIGLSSVLAKGDLIVGSSASVVSNLPVGTNGQVLTANSAAPLGVDWEAINVTSLDIFGDGSNTIVTFDGSTTFSFSSIVSSSVYTLTTDAYGTGVVIKPGVTVNSSGWRIFATMGSSVQGTYQNNGSAGANGGSVIGVNANAGAGGAGGAGAASGYFPAGVSGVNGQGGGAGTTSGGQSPGVSSAVGINSSHSLSVGNASQGGNGGNGGSGVAGGGTGGTAATQGTTTFRTIAPNSLFPIISMFDVTNGSLSLYNTQAGSSGGGGGAGGGGDNGAHAGGGGGGAGGSGGNGGILGLYSKDINVAFSGVIQANGGAGGNGGHGGDGAPGGGNAGGGGGGGGGAGGNGGVTFLVYQSITNNGSILALGGTAGNGGVGGLNQAGVKTGVDGSGGTNGGAGTVIQRQLV